MAPKFLSWIARLGLSPACWRQHHSLVSASERVMRS